MTRQHSVVRRANLELFQIIVVCTLRLKIHLNVLVSTTNYCFGLSRVLTDTSEFLRKKNIIGARIIILIYELSFSLYYIEIMARNI